MPIPRKSKKKNNLSLPNLSKNSDVNKKKVPKFSKIQKPSHPLTPEKPPVINQSNQPDNNDSKDQEEQAKMYTADEVQAMLAQLKNQSTNNTPPSSNDNQEENDNNTEDNNVNEDSDDSKDEPAQENQEEVEEPEPEEQVPPEEPDESEQSVDDNDEDPDDSISEVDNDDVDDSDKDFHQLTAKQVADEDTADDVEYNSTNQFVGDDKSTEPDIDEEHINQTIGKRTKKWHKKNHGKQHIYRTDKTDNPFEPGTDTQAEDPDAYIDKKNKKIIPWGGAKSRPRKGKKFHGAQRYDDRKNLSKTVKMLRFLVMTGMLLVIGMGIKNTFFLHVPNRNEITAIAENVSGNTGYPTQRAEAFAEQFAQAYLNFNGENQNSQVMNYFYSGNNNSNPQGSSTPLTVGPNAQQKIIIDPKVFDSEVATNYSATFYVNALVTNLKGKTQDSEGDQLTHWVGLAINILYNKKNDSLKISQNSPALVPTFKVTTDQSTANATPNLGTGTAADDSVFDKMTPTIQGFLNAYAQSTSTNHSKLDQYIIANADNSVISGFGGQYKFLTGSSNFSGTAYPVSNNKKNNEWKVDLSLAWEDTGSKGNASAVYTGRYVMTIKKAHGKYFVLKFVPYTYIYNPNNN